MINEFLISFTIYSSRRLWRLFISRVWSSLWRRKVFLIRKTKVWETDLSIWVGLLQSHHLLVNLLLELIVHSHWSLSSYLDLWLFNLTESFEITNGWHNLFCKNIDVLCLLGLVDIKGWLEHSLQTNSLLEQKIKICYLNLEIVCSLSFLTDSSWLVCRELFEESLHQTSDDILLSFSKSHWGIELFALWVFICSTHVQHVLESDELNCYGVMKFFSLHLDCEVLPSNNLIVLLDIDDWEVDRSHNLSKFRFTGCPMFICQFSILNLWSLVENLLWLDTRITLFFVVNEYIGPVIPFY